MSNDDKNFYIKFIEKTVLITVIDASLRRIEEIVSDGKNVLFLKIYCERDTRTSLNYPIQCLIILSGNSFFFLQVVLAYSLSRKYLFTRQTTLPVYALRNPKRCFFVNSERSWVFKIQDLSLRVGRPHSPQEPFISLHSYV